LGFGRNFGHRWGQASYNLIHRDLRPTCAEFLRIICRAYVFGIELVLRLCNKQLKFVLQVLVRGSPLFEHHETSHVENLEERCGRELGFASSDCSIGDAGSYCVISTIWPCRKVKFLA
jgi:hypothetical protein